MARLLRGLRGKSSRVHIQNYGAQCAEKKMCLSTARGCGAWGVGGAAAAPAGALRPYNDVAKRSARPPRAQVRDCSPTTAQTAPVDAPSPDAPCPAAGAVACAQEAQCAQHEAVLRCGSEGYCSLYQAFTIMSVEASVDNETVGATSCCTMAGAAQPGDPCPRTINALLPNGGA